MFDLVIRHLAQQMVNAVQPRTLLVDGLHDPPRRFGNVRALQHHFLRLRVRFPAAPAFQIHRAQLPLLQRIENAVLEADFLLFVGDREPVFDDLDAAAHEHFFELGHRTEELFVFVVGAEIHHALDARAVVPAAVEQHHFAACRQMLRVALEIPLRAFAVVRRGQRRDAAHARIQTLRDALDRAALAGRIAALEDHDEPVARVHDPVLQLDQFALQAEQLAEILLARLAGLGGDALFAVEDAVVHFHFEFLVIGIDEVFFETALTLGKRRGVVGHVTFFHPGSPVRRKWVRALCTAASTGRLSKREVSTVLPGHGCHGICRDHGANCHDSEFRDRRGPRSGQAGPGRASGRRLSRS